MGNCNMGAAHSSSDPATAAKSVVRVARALARAAQPPFSELSPTAHRGRGALPRRRAGGVPWLWLRRRRPPQRRARGDAAVHGVPRRAHVPRVVPPRRARVGGAAVLRHAHDRRRRQGAVADRARARGWLHFARGGRLLRHPLLLPRAPRPISACASQVGEFVWQSWSQIADKVDAGACACRRRRFTGCKQALRPARRCWPRLLVIVRRPRAPPRSLPQWPLRWWR